MNLKDAEAEIIKAEADPLGYFGAGDSAYKSLARVVHPDRYVGSAFYPQAEQLMKRLNAAYARLETPVVRLVSTTGEEFEQLSKLGSGSLCDVFLCQHGSEQVVVKLSRVPGKAAGKLLIKERELLSECREKESNDVLRMYVPFPAGSYQLASNPQIRFTVFKYTPGLYTAEQVHAEYPGGVGGRHLAWMFKRLLTAMRLAHHCNYVHAAILPPHILFGSGNGQLDHGVQLCGWIHATKAGQPIKLVPAAYKDWYPAESKTEARPATDLYLAARCMQYLGGYDHDRAQWPSNVPMLMQAFFKGCLLESANMRPQDMAVVYTDFSTMLEGVYGKPRFVELPMPANEVPKE